VKHLAASGLGPLAPDLTELIIGTVAFLIVFGLLARVLMPRISTTLEARTDAIEGGLHRAEEAQAALEGMDYTGKDAAYSMRDVHRANVRFTWEGLA